MSLPIIERADPTPAGIDTLAEIVKHGLSIRQIPLRVFRALEMQHFQPGDEVVESEVGGRQYDWLKRFHRNPDNYRFDDAQQKVFRRYARRTIVPEHAGCWMCKQVTDTGSTVVWDIRTDNLAPTLAESVALFLSRL